MKANRLFSILTIAPVLFVTAPSSMAAEHSKWCYNDPSCSPCFWGQLDEHFKACGIGQKQSPVDLPTPKGEDGQLIVNYQPTQGTILINNGHTWQVDYSSGSGELRYDDKSYQLVQFHFHTPSEHTVAGKPFPMEAHLVHAAGNSLAVIGVFFREGAENQFLKQFWDQMPAHTGATNTSLNLNVEELLPQKRAFQTYAGSLTTPPCDERVRWIVLSEPVEASKAQIESLTHAMHGDNARPTQPLHGRVIQDSKPKAVVDQ